uniref:Uncharacterized protein n=1 Tax=Hyaloperonospora arabidopsidis (strain Emoy2) TaxID=559515 RepID=M4B1L1_HYAAE
MPVHRPNPGQDTWSTQWGRSADRCHLGCAYPQRPTASRNGESACNRCSTLRLDF